jgi:DNA/RNA endonuclease G (NUC1)
MLERLLTVDVEDLFENHLWLELLSSLESALLILTLYSMIIIEDVHISLAISALYFRFMQAFKSHLQGLDEINSYLRYLSQQWNETASHKAKAPTLLAVSQYALFIKASRHSPITQLVHVKKTPTR